MASNWAEFKDPKGVTYYFNKVTQSSSWEKPLELQTPFEKALSKSEWQEFSTPEGKKYYFNKTTQKTCWEVPQDVQKILEQSSQEPSAMNQSSEPPQNPANASGNSLGSTEGSDKVHSHSSSTSSSPSQTTSSLHPSNNSQTTTLSTTPASTEDASVPDKTLTSAATSAAVAKPQYTTPEESKAGFFQLLRDNHITSRQSWDEVMPKIIRDSRYNLMFTLLLRKQAFFEYQSLKRKEEAAAVEQRLQRKKDALMDLFVQFKEHLYTIRWRDVAEAFRSHPVFLAVEVRDRQSVYQKFCDSFEPAFKERRQAIRERNKDKFQYLLEQMNLTYASEWQTVFGDFVQCDEYVYDSTLQDSDKSDLLDTFEKLIFDLEKQEEVNVTKRKLEMKLAQAENRDHFVAFLRQHRGGALGDELDAKGFRVSLDTKWKEVVGKFREEKVYRSILGQSGSSPLDLFKIVQHEMKESYQNDKDLVRSIMKSCCYSVSSADSFLCFVEQLSKDARFATVDKFHHLRLYERFMKRAHEKEKEERHKLRRKHKKTLKSFQKSLFKVRPALNSSSKWEVYKDILSTLDSYKEVQDEVLLRGAFEEFIAELEPESDLSEGEIKEPKLMKKRKESVSGASSLSGSDVEAGVKSGKRKRKSLVK